MRPWVAALLLGALSAAALPPLHVVPVLFIAVPGLLALIGRRVDARGAGWAGFWFGLGHHVFGLYWITEAILIEAARFWWLVPLAVPALSAVLALFIALPCALARRVPAGLPRLLVLAGGWVLADLARQFVATGFPWNPWGSVWAIPGGVGDVFLQPAAAIGVHGLTLATLLLTGLPSLGRRGWVAACVLLAGWGGFGVWRLSGPAPGAADVALVIVQGNVPQGEKWDRGVALEIFRRYLALTRSGVAQAGNRPVAVIWPETASPYPLEIDANARAAVAEAAAPGVALVGSVRWDAAGRPRNSLMALTGPGPAVAMYDKAHLVPFGEYQPSWMPLPIQVVPGDGFGAGPGPRTLHVPGLPPVGPLICYEAAFPGQVVAADRPAWMVNVTNDAWFGNSAGPRQHLAAARLRAVEEGLPLARAANTGISAVFDAFGREIGRRGMGETGVLVTALPGALPATPFARFGLWIPGVLAGIGLVLGRVLAGKS